MDRGDAKRVKVKVVAIESKRKFVFRWTDEDGRQRQKACATKVRREAIRQAVALEDELTDQLRRRSSGWNQFKARYVAEHCAGSAPYAWGLMVRRVEAIVSAIESVSQVDASVLSQAVSDLRADDKQPATIKGYLKHFKASLNWARRMGFIDKLPEFPRIKKPRNRMARARPVTGEEFDRMVSAAEAMGKQSLVPVMYACYLGGLRRSEVCRLTADPNGEFAILLDRETVVFRIDKQKNGEAQLLLAAPDFVEYLRTLEDLPRKGRLFRDVPRTPDGLGREIASVGEQAGIIVNRDGKTASAHDLRRAFGTRWAKTRISPADLCTLMRHKDIKTVMEYYVEVDNDDLAKRLAAASGTESRPGLGDQTGDQSISPENQIAKKHR